MTEGFGIPDSQTSDGKQTFSIAGLVSDILLLRKYFGDVCTVEVDRLFGGPILDSDGALKGFSVRAIRSHRVRNHDKATSTHRLLQDLS